MDKNTIPMKLIFTSYRDSIGLDGLKVSLDKHAPKLCSYSALNYLIMPIPKGMTLVNMERICDVILDNNWNLIQDFIGEVHSLELYQLTMCCWCTKEQITTGRFCPAGIIGRYIQNKESEFGFPIKIEYRDGREGL